MDTFSGGRSFRDPQLIRSVYKASIDRVGEDPFLFQQEAIFEMNSADGSIEKSGELLRKATELQPKNRLIKHSLAEWALKKAEKSEIELEKNKYRRESAKISRELSREDSTSAYPFVTLVKVGIEELSEVAGSGDEPTIERKVSEIERALAEAKQQFPEDSYLLYEESRFCEMLDRNPEAKTALEHAFSNNKGSPFIAVRLARLYENAGESEKAIKVLSECVDAKPSDKYANYNLATLLAKYHPEMKAAIRMHLRKSFTDGDSNYAAQFWYARFLYVDGAFGEAKKYFDALVQTRLNPETRDAFRGPITDTGKPIIFQGVVSKKEHSFGFIRRDGHQDMVFVHRNDVDERLWEDLKEGNRVEFEMGFSYRGPKARYVRKEAVVRSE